MEIIKQKDFDRMSSKKIKLDRGGLWEENEITILFDAPIFGADKVNCPHLSKKYIVRNHRDDKSFYDTVYANCPKVIVAVNEGGYNSTGVCLDCVLEQADTSDNSQ